ncbi:MAG TPA: ABC transporter permease [Chitinophagaceae bacterium]|nr:ABC transporter permease [Chitinophagaceae bacterium]
MLTNYFRIAMRNLLKRKGFTTLNIMGLAIGITCCVLIFQYVSYERSYDTFEKNAGRIVRIRLDQYKQGQLAWQSATSYPAIGPTLKKDYPEVENFCRLIDDNLLLSNQSANIKFSETKGYYADPAAIDMLGINLTKGNAATALNAPGKIIISQSMAKKYFGTGDALNKLLTVRSGNIVEDYQVGGVFKDYPANSHLIIDYLVPYSKLEQEQLAEGDSSNAVNTSFGWYDFYTYLQLKPGTDINKFQAKLPAFANKYINSQEWCKTNNIKDWLYVIPLSDIYLYSNYNQEAEVNGNGSVVNFMFLIGFIIMAIAWINYINLSTARSVERAREVGVRKVLGAGKAGLVRQFMVESLLLNLAAIFIAALAVYLLTPVFNTLMGRNVPAGFGMSLKYWLIFTGIFIAGSLLSGLYPSFVLSNYKPLLVLKGAFKNSSGGLLLRKGLIILQFSVSVILIAGTIVVYQQVQFMRSQQLGANINQTLVLNGAQSVGDSVYANTLQPFKTTLLQQAGIKSIAASTSVMGGEIYWTNGIKSLNHKELGAVTLYLLGIDYDFIPQFELKLLAGRNFSRNYSTDKHAAIVNRQAAKLLGFKNADDALNKKISRGGQDTLTIIGVVEDYHHLGLQHPIDPQLILLRPNARNSYSVKLQTTDLSKTIAAAERTWNRFFPNDPFSYYFLDDQFNQQYKADQQFGKVFTLFALLAILIACFGLLGLSAYNILQRTKEVGIRKVLGASVANVLFILSKDFLWLVTIAFVVAAPIAWWLMYNWLQGFAYRITISWWVFGIAGILAVIIALGAISFQAIKAALANPVKSLRSE